MSPSPDRTSAPTLAPLTGVRAFAAMLIVVNHVPTAWANGYPFRVDFAPMSYIGVDLFFVLSGFILMHVHARDFTSLRWHSTWRFICLRIFRIYPVHVVTLVLALVYFILLRFAGANISGLTRFSARAFIENIFLVQSWWWAINFSWNSPAWSISAEWFAYLMFPALALLLRPLRGSLLLIAVVVGALGAQIAVMAVLLGLPDLQADAYRMGPIRIAGSFTAGMALNLLYASHRLDRLPWAAIEIGAFSILCFQIWVIGGSFAALFPIAALIIALAYGRGPISSLFRSRLAVYLGEISYSLYMCHLILFELLLLPVNMRAPMVFSPTAGAAISLLLIGVAMIAAHCCYNWIELPARVGLKRALDRQWPDTRDIFAARITPPGAPDRARVVQDQGL